MSGEMEDGLGAEVSAAEAGEGESWGPTKVLDPTFGAVCTVGHKLCQAFTRWTTCRGLVFDLQHKVDHCPVCKAWTLTPLLTNATFVLTVGAYRLTHEECDWCGRRAAGVYERNAAGGWSLRHAVGDHPANEHPAVAR